MKYVLVLLGFSFSTFLFCQNEAERVIKSVEISEIKAEIKNHDFMLLDVRTPEEFSAGHLENAVNINYYDQDFTERISALQKQKKIIVYCAAGGRSSQALKKLDELGFQYVLNMEGGYNGWKAQQ